MSQPRPCSSTEAVARALRWVGKGTYVLGSGDYRPTPTSDAPYTLTHGIDDASDCWGFAGAYCLKLPRHRVGFNNGGWATVSDDINTDSAIEDSEHRQDLFAPADRPRAGDLLVWPSIRDGRLRLRIGHVAIIVSTARLAEWDPALPTFDLLDVVQCQSSTRPAIKASTGGAWMWRYVFRGKRDPAWASRVLRVKP